MYMLNSLLSQEMINWQLNLDPRVLVREKIDKKLVCNNEQMPRMNIRITKHMQK